MTIEERKQFQELEVELAITKRQLEKAESYLKAINENASSRIISDFAKDGLKEIQLIREGRL